MKKILYIFLPIALASCSVEDKGNYSYSELNTVTIDSIDGSYSKLAKIDQLDITPKLSGSITGDDLDKYEYHWFLCSGQHVHETIGTEKDLHYKVDLTSGTYKIYFSVKDKNTGLEWIKNTTLNVTTSFTKGFLLLGEEENGEVRMDMIVMPSGRDTVIAERVYDNAKAKLQGAQQLIFTGYSVMNNQALWLTSGDRSTKLTSSASLKHEKDYPEFTPVGTVEELGWIETEFKDLETPMIVRDVFPRQYSGGCRCRSQRGFITNDAIIVSQITTAEYYTNAVNKYSATSTELFEPYPLAFMKSNAYMSTYAVPGMFYDMTNQRFVLLNGGGNLAPYMATHCTSLASYDYAGDVFKWQSGTAGHSIVYGENASDNNSYTIMKDADDNRFIYQFYVGGPYSYYLSKRGNYQVDFSIAKNFKEASFYTFMGNKTVVVYAVGSTLYAYDFSRKMFTEKNMDAEICCLEAEYTSRGTTNEFMVATFDDATQTGTVRKMTVGGGNNAVTLEEKPREIWDVTLKIKDIEWKNSN